MFATIIKSIRLPFLILTPICIFYAASIVSYSGQAIEYTELILILIAAISAHISVNTFNEYLDFTSGLDLKTKRTPFSGGSGALPANPGHASAVLISAIISLVMTVVIGVYFVLQNIWLLPIGLLGVILVVFYTRWINKSPWLCLFSPGIAFGLIMILGSELALTNNVTLMCAILSTIPFFLVNNLLLLNQYPDIKPDREIGRNHFPIAYGINNSNKIYALFNMLTACVIGLGVYYLNLPTLVLLALIPLLATIIIHRAICQLKHKIRRRSQFLALNVLVTLLTPTIVASVLFLAN